MSARRECAVCGLPSAGTHFGVFSCRACGAFFRRTNAMGLQYKCARGSGCEIGKKQRLSCRQCRFEKCLRVGMKYLHSNDMDDETTSSSSYSEDRRSKRENNANPSHRRFMIKFVETSHDCNIPTVVERVLCENIALDVQILPYNLRLNLLQRATLAFCEHHKSLPKPYFATDQYELECTEAERCFRIQIKGMAQFMMSFKEFATLPKDQKWSIFRACWLSNNWVERHMTSFLEFGGESVIGKAVLNDGSIHHPDAILTIAAHFSNDSVDDAISVFMPGFRLFQTHFMAPMIACNATLVEVVFSMFYNMWNVKCIKDVKAETVAVAERMLEQMGEDMCHYYKYEERRKNYVERFSAIMNAAMSLKSLERQRQEDRTMSQAFSILKRDTFLEELAPNLRY